MLPPAVEKRSLIGFLRRIVTDDLLAQFVWESSAEGKSLALKIFSNLLILNKHSRLPKSIRALKILQLPIAAL